MAKYYNTRLTDEIEQLLKYEMFTRPDQDEIYHYTSLTSLDSILTKKIFWATESRFMNDAGETTYIEDVLYKVGLKLTKDGSDEKLINFVTFLYSQLKTTNYDQKNYWTYILSFSTKRDSLAMWNYYGKNDGYCIGLDYKTLLKKKKENIQEKKNHAKYGTAIASVIYSEKKQIEIMEREIDLLYKYYLSNISTEVPSVSPTKDSVSQLVNDDIIDIPQEIELQFADVVINRWKKYLAGIMKHPSFEPEQEVRMMFKLNKGTEDIKYRVYRGIMAPYIEIDDILHVRSIMIGPMIKHDQALMGLCNWLAQPEIEVNLKDEDITQSSIPLRF